MQPVQRRFGTADVGGFGIVDPTHAVMIQHQLETMRQTGKGGQRLETAGPRQTGSISQRQCSQRVAVVVLPGDVHLFDVQDLLTFHSQPGFSLLAVKVIVADINAEADAALIGAAYRHRQPIIGIHNAGFRIFIHPQFGRTILLQTQRVTVHMILGHVEDRCGHRPQTGGGFQLEAGELQNVQFAVRIE